MTHDIYLLRHGVSTGNRDSVIQGQLDYPLSAEGQTQIQRLANAWSQSGLAFDEIITSPLVRARKSAEIIAETLSVPITTDRLWVERDAGTAQGRPWQERPQQLSGAQQPNAYQPLFGDGESLIALHQRATSALAGVISRPGGTYLVVAHGGILSAAVLSALGLQPSAWAIPAYIRFDNAAFAELVLDDQRQTWSVLHVNCSLPPTNSSQRP